MVMEVRARAGVCDCRFTLGKPRLDGELMRHSDVRLTMKIYIDVSKLLLGEAVAALPSFEGGNPVPGLPKNRPLKIINVRTMSSCVVVP
jgi:hypothetical protein